MPVSLSHFRVEGAARLFPVHSRLGLIPGDGVLIPRLVEAVDFQFHIIGVGGVGLIVIHPQDGGIDRGPFRASGVNTSNADMARSTLQNPRVHLPKEKKPSGERST